MEYPSANDFYCRSNTHDPDQDRFEDLYRCDFIHAISRVARHKLARHHLDPYQHATFRHGIIHYNTGEEETDPTLELAMEYASMLSTIVFDESCCLHDLTKRQVGQNQFAVDVAVDRLDREADHATEHIGALEDKMADVEQGLNGLLELGREQTKTLTQTARGLGQLATCVSGHDIFELLFRPILHSFLERSSFHFANVSLMTLTNYELSGFIVENANCVQD